MYYLLLLCKIFINFNNNGKSLVQNQTVEKRLLWIMLQIMSAYNRLQN